jgi:serine/threonine-protein kinase
MAEIHTADWTRINDAADRFERAWKQGQRPRIEDYLAEADPGLRAALLEELLRVERELRRGQGEDPGPREYSLRFSQHAELIRAVFGPGPDRPETEGQPADSKTTAPVTTGLEPGDNGDLPPGTLIGYFGDYQLIKELGRGGMGIVYKARQLSLNRLVALKMLRAGALATEDDLRRFQNEAEAVAMLDHPHIVPILEVGQHDGRRYFSMKLIGGQSLDRKLGEFTADLKASARLVKTLAEAVHHAHQRGILHRDLKPGNVLLDEHGEPHVTDFGLAKRVQADGDLTLSGAILGTPAYMAPEQASGNRRLVTTVTDVYGLGAILYALVTGRAPFRGDSPAQTLEQVRGWTLEPPSKLNPRVLRDLEVIVLKCLEKEPERRYGSAAALVDDLQRYLDGEPILARPTGLAIRAWMWCKRNPALARLASALMLAVLVLLILGAGIILVERHRRLEAEARVLAQTNFDLARKAVEDYFTRVSEDTLLKKQDSVDIRRLRGELLTMALGYYREFLRQRSNDPELRRQLADAQFRVGQILFEIGDRPEEALAAFNASIALWDELRSAAPDDPEVRARLARVYLALGAQHTWSRDFPPAFAAFGRSRDILMKLHGERRADASYRFSLADCDCELGVAEGEAGELDRGLEHLKEAESLLRGLLSESPADAVYRKRLADGFNGQGFIYSRKRQDAQALGAFRQFQEICQSLLAEIRSGPRPAKLLDSLGTSYYNVGAILSRLDRSKVLESFEKALEYRSALAEVHPSVSDFRERLAVSLAEIAPLRHEAAGRDEEAFAAIRRSIEIFDKLVASQPDQPRYRAELGRALNILGYLHDEFRDNTRALPALERALQEVQRAVADSPVTDLYKEWEVNILQNLGEQYADFGRVDEGLPHYRRAVEIRRRLLDAHPGDKDLTLELADQLAMLAGFERHGGHPAEAERLYADAADRLESLAAAAADRAVQVGRGTFLMGRGRAAADQGADARALPILRRAVAVLKPFGSSATDDPRPRQRLTEALWEAARISRRTGAADEADRLEAERQALWKDRSPGDLAALAMAENTQAATVGYGRLPVGDLAEAVRRLDLDLAAANLRLAISLGFRDLSALRKNPDATLLLSRDEMRSQIMDLVFPAWPFDDNP